MRRAVVYSACFFALVSSAHAAPILWTLNNVVFGDGGTATGSFVFNADAGPIGTFISFNISSQGGTSGLGPNRHGFQIPREETFFFRIVPQLLPDLTDSPVLELSYPDSSLSDDGGTVPILGVSEGTCFNSDCSAVFGFARLSISAGTLAGSATREPTSVSLVAFGLCALFWRRRRWLQ